MTNVAIVGGGYAGMAAAVRLCQAGLTCTVFEAAPVLGGRARRIDYKGAVLDNGQHILSGAYTELLGLIRHVSAPDHAFERIRLNLHIPPSFDLQAPYLPAPLHLAWALLTAKGLDASSRIAAVKFMRALKSRRFKVDESWTVEQLLRAHNQPLQLTEFLWAPLTLSALNTPVGVASAQVFVNVLRDALASSRAASDLILPKTDLSALFPEPAAAWVSRHGGVVKTGCRVHAIMHDGGGFQVHDKNSIAAFSAIILAVGPHQFDALALPIPNPASALRYEPIYTVYLKYPGTVPLKPAMVGRATGLVQWFFNRHALSNLPMTEGVVAGVISASGQHEALTRDELAQCAHAELQQLTGPLPPPLWQKVIAEKFATFSCIPGAPRPGTLTGVAGCFLAGDYVACDYPATLEGAVRNGLAAAAQACSFLRNKTST